MADLLPGPTTATREQVTVWAGPPAATSPLAMWKAARIPAQAAARGPGRKKFNCVATGAGVVRPKQECGR